MPRASRVDKLILTWLKLNPGLKTSIQVQKGVNASYPSVVRHLRRMAQEGRVKQFKGPKNSFKYEFASHEVQRVIKTDRETYRKLAPALPEYLPVGPEDLTNICIHWGKNGWKPQAVPAAQTLCEVLAKFYRFYWLELDRGITVDQVDLDFCKQRLSAARDQVAKFQEFFDRLLATPQLWDAGKSLNYVLGNVQDPIAVCNQAKEVDTALRH